MKNKKIPQYPNLEVKDWTSFYGYPSFEAVIFINHHTHIVGNGTTRKSALRQAQIHYNKKFKEILESIPHLSDFKDKIRKRVNEK